MMCAVSICACPTFVMICHRPLRIERSCHSFPPQNVRAPYSAILLGWIWSAYLHLAPETPHTHEARGWAARAGGGVVADHGNAGMVQSIAQAHVSGHDSFDSPVAVVDRAAEGAMHLFQSPCFSCALHMIRHSLPCSVGQIARRK